MKTQRQAKILEIISTRNVETQEQLLDALQKEGFRGTQATISRDIKELRLVKTLANNGNYKNCNNRRPLCRKNNRNEPDTESIYRYGILGDIYP